MKKFFFVATGLSSLLVADFSRSGDIVTDTTTGLQWQDNSDAKTVKKTWTEAITYCENLTLGGYDDWRLPNFNELYNLSDRSKYDPAIDSIFQNIFSSTFSGGYWSSTTVARYKNHAWFVNFLSGHVYYVAYKSDPYHVRCVRTND